MTGVIETGLSSFESWEIGIHIIEIVAIIVLWVNRKGQVATDAVESLDVSINERVDDVQLKIVELETQFKGSHMEALRKDIVRMHGEIKKMEGQMEGVEKALTQLAYAINPGSINKRANDLAG